MKQIKKLQEEIFGMLAAGDCSCDINEVVTEINKNRALGSSNQCYRIMYKAARYFNVRKVLDIGTHKATSAIIFAQAILDNKLIPEVHTVDDWSQAAIKQMAADNIDRSGVGKYITMHEGDTLKILPSLVKKMGEIDLAFIDGNHDPKYVVSDYMNVKDRCDIILFHDTGDGNRVYLPKVAEEFNIYNFETHYLEGDGHLVGIAICLKK